jgi:hypothetical protein
MSVRSSRLSVLSALGLGEHLAPLTLVGGSLLLAGIAFASLPSLRRPSPVDALVEPPG